MLYLHAFTFVTNIIAAKSSYTAPLNIVDEPEASTRKKIIISIAIKYNVQNEAFITHNHEQFIITIQLHYCLAKILCVSK